MTNAPILDANRIAAELERLGTEWADNQAAASVMEETKPTLLAKIAKEHMADGASATKAELLAKADPVYEQHVRDMVEAERKAVRAKVRYDTYKIKAELLRSNASTERALAVLK